MSSRFISSTPTFSLSVEDFGRALELMEEDDAFNTVSTYSANSTLHPDHKVSFKDKHLAYLKVHKETDPAQYLANLRLIAKIR